MKVELIVDKEELLHNAFDHLSNVSVMKMNVLVCELLTDLR